MSLFLFYCFAVIVFYSYLHLAVAPGPAPAAKCATNPVNVPLTVKCAGMSANQKCIYNCPLNHSINNGSTIQEFVCVADGATAHWKPRYGEICRPRVCTDGPEIKNVDKNSAAK